MNYDVGLVSTPPITIINERNYQVPLRCVYLLLDSSYKETIQCQPQWHEVKVMQANGARFLIYTGKVFDLSNKT